MASRADEIRARRLADEEEFVKALGRTPTLEEANLRANDVNPGRDKNPLGYADEFGGDVVDAGLSLAGGMAGAAMEGGSKAYDALRSLMSSKDPAREQYDQGWRPPMVTSDQISDAVRPPVGQAHAKPLLNFRPNPNTERKIQDEAKGLMADEAGRQSSPMALPNQPRDPDAERMQRAKAKAMMAPKGPMGAPPGQDNFATPTPTAFERAKVSGALMMPPVQKNVTDPKAPMAMPEDNMVRVTPGSYYDDSQPIPEAGRPMGLPPMAEMGPEAPVDNPTLSPGGDYGLGLSELGEQPVDNLSNPGPLPTDPNDPREKLKAYLARENSPEGVSRKDAMNNAYIGSMRDTNKTNSDLGFMNLLMASANQFGNRGGDVIPNTEYEKFTKGQMGQNERSNELLGKVSTDKQKQEDERLKGMMFLAKQKQDEEKYQSDLAQRGKMAEDLAGYRKGMLENQAASNANNDWFRQTQMTNQDRQNREMMDFRRNPPEKKMTPLDEATINLRNKQAEQTQWEMDHPKKQAGMQDVRNKSMAGTYDEWVQQGLRSNVQTGIDTLKQVASELDKDNWGSGTIVGNTPNAILGMVGNKAPKYEAAINGAIAASFKQKLGGSFTESEGQRLLKNTWDPKQSPKENADRVRRAIKEMEGKMKMQDDAVKYFEANDANMGGYKGGTQAIQSSQSNKGASGSWDNAPSMRAEDL